MNHIQFRPNALVIALSTLVALALIGSAVSGCTPKTKDDVPNTVQIAVPAKIKGLDPAMAGDLYSGEMIGNLYEGLLDYDYLKRPYRMKPNLAESMPTVSKDGKIYTFKIKKGVLFQDDAAFKATGGKGRELVAEDFIYSWKRLADPKVASEGWWIFENKIVGLDEWRQAASQSGAADYSAPIAGLQAVDAYTLKVTLKERSYLFNYFLAMPFSYVVAREVVETYGKEFINHPVGTGPFRLVEFNPSAKLIFVRNPTYRKELFPSEGMPEDKTSGVLSEAGKPLPLADKLVVTVFEETQPMWLSFMSGKLDLGGIPKDNFAQAITPGKELQPELKAKGVTLYKTMQLDVTHTSFNMADPLFAKNKLLRQAISLAYDQAEYNEKFYSGQALAAQGPIPPGLTGYHEKYKNPYRQYNVARAKELLAKAGFPGGKGLPVLEYNSQADTTSRQSSEYLTKALAAIGIKIKVNTYSWPEFLASVKQKRGQMWSYAWGADYPDAENFLQLFYSKNASPGPNDSNYSNPEFDRLYEKSLTLPDGPARTALYNQMVALVVEDCPWIFGAHRLKFTLAQPWLRGYKPHSIDHGRFKYIRVEPSLKK